MDACYIVVHKLSHTSRLGDNHTQLDRLSKLPGLLHKANKLLGFKDSLGLEVVCASHYLALHLSQLSIYAVAAGRDNRALGKLRRRANQRISAQVNAFFQLADRVQQGHRIQIKHGLCAWMVTKGGMVAGKAKDIIDTQHSGAQQIGLEADAVAVTAGNLEDGG